ncbi:MAG TPA: phospholipase D-like domain-containing protein, partial [Polyangiaceae bacterium]|nr:phospholipase D-like domain-containing protein [Polyangiaceae bacterium]
SRARRHILIAGWQFDSDVALLRGDAVAAEAGGRPVALRAFLNDLCERKPELSVYLLAWDYHAVFALEREWLQRIIFAWTTNERLHFRFDASHVEHACHHQKFVVVDGDLSFVGGLDLCDHRWDDRRHLEANPLRSSRGEPHKPFHDVQSYLVGREAARELASLFACRWRAAGGEELSLEAPPEGASAFDATYAPAGALPLRAEVVALSRTDPHGAPTEARGCREVCELYRAAIAAAERLIYVETQYFSSRAIGEALEARLRDPAAPALDVVLVLNMRAETLKEEIAVGLAQAKVIAGVRTAAAGTAHRLGIYYTVPEPLHGEPARATYIHSKIMVVDDVFLTVGSANLTNRSVGVDTELNASFEADGPDDPLAAGIAAARRSLLAEHLGLAAFADPEGGLVPWLEGLAERREGRLRPHPSPTPREAAILAVIDPAALPFDPDAAEDDEERRSLFATGIGELWRRLFGES